LSGQKPHNEEGEKKRRRMKERERKEHEFFSWQRGAFPKKKRVLLGKSVPGKELDLGKPKKRSFLAEDSLPNSEKRMINGLREKQRA